MAKIYVSSTFLDLEEFREKILSHLHRLQQAVGAMEYYLADDRRPAEKSVADVKTCDIYVGIFAWRYGTVPEENNPDKLSITEMEYRAARARGIPCLVFLHNGKSPWSPDLVDDDKTRIKAFRKKVEGEQTPQWFKNSDELASLVGASLYDKLIALGYGAPATQVTSFDLEKYFSALRKRYSVLALEGLTPPQKEEYLQIQLRSVFVEQNVRENPPPVEIPKEVWEKLSRDKEIHPEDLPSGITLDDVRKAREAYYEKPSRPVLDVLIDSRYQHAIILGDPGSGKSTLARYVMLSLIDSATADDKLQKAFAGYLPLLIELRSYAGLIAGNKCETFLEFLEFLGKTEGWGLTQIALSSYLKNDGRAVVIFDGLDEIFDPELRERIAHQIVGFAGDYPKARVIVTSRVIGYRRKILTDAGFTHFTLQDLDEKQVETFVRRWYDLAMSERPDEAKERRERILRSFKESESIRALAGNPMLLTIMAIIGKHQELPRERWKLYDHAASVLIQHWDVNKHLKDARIDADFIGEDDKKELLRRLAFRMQSGEGGLAGNYIHRDQLQAEFEDYLKARYAQTPDRAAIIARAMIEQFRERNFILSLYGANLYGFVHRAFLEYFCASAFVYNFEKTKELTIEELKLEVYGKHWEDQSWHEVLRLICGMVDEKWAAAIINYLASEVYRRQPKRLRERPRLKFELALQCLSDIRSSNALRPLATRLIRTVCKLLERSNYAILLQITDSHDIFPALEIIGTSWPSEDILADWLSSAEFSDDTIPLALEGIANFIATMGWGSRKISVVLHRMVNNKSKGRTIVPFTLALGWRDDKRTLPTLKKLAINDSNANVRVLAVRALAQFYPTMDTFSFLSKIACNDQVAWVRSGILHEIAEHFSKNPESSVMRRDLFRERALKDTDGLVRSSAVHALARYFHNDGEILLLLHDRAVNDVDWRVRQSTMEAIGHSSRTDESTLALLRERAENDPSPRLRRYAKHLAEETVDYFDWQMKLKAKESKEQS